MHSGARTVAVALAVSAAAAAIGHEVVSGQSRQTAPPTARAAQRVPLASEWPTYGHDPGGMRFSPLTQITPANVGQLQPAWVYHMKPPATSASAPSAEGSDAPPPQAP